MSDGRWMQDAVRAFHRATDNPAPSGLDLGGVRCELRATLILEEAIETVEALGFDVEVIHLGTGGHRATVVRRRDPDWPAVLDGLCDVIYVSLGTAVEMGVQLGPFFAEVHRSNMSKTGAPIRADGKTLKPAGWQPPRIAYLWGRVLERAGKS